MWRFFVLLSFVLFSVSAFPQSLPVTPMQNSVSGVLQSKMQSRGFAANDPRWGSTIQAAGSSIAGAAAAAAAVSVAGITAPAWVTAGITVGVGALLGYGINLAVDGLKWLLNSDGSVQTAASPPAATPLTSGGGFWSRMNAFEGIGSSPSAAVSASMSDAWIAGGGQVTQCTISGSTASCTIWDGKSKYADGSYFLDYASVGYQASGSPCASNTGACRGSTSFSIPSTGSSSGVSSNLAVAAANVSSADAGRALNPEIVAALANNAWKQAAAQPGYAGLPFDVFNPITPTDAAAWQAANPAAWPKVGDFVAPQPAPSGGTTASPFQLPTSLTPVQSVPSTSTPTTVNPATGEQVNLGSDPGIGAPTLEATPTAQAILQPLLDLFPSLRNFVVPSHGGECPKPSATVFGKALVMDGHCSLLEPVRGDLSAVMAFAWACIALFLILSA